MTPKKVSAVALNRQGPKVYCAVGKQPRHRTVGDLEKRDEAPAPGKGAPVKEVMGHRLKTAEGKKIYKKRKETEEPVFGIMSLRGAELRGILSDALVRTEARSRGSL